MKIFLLLAFAGCTAEQATAPSYTGHAQDPWQELERSEREGPPRYTSRLHSCAKMRVATLGNLLASRGVNLAATGELSAGRIYATSASALGAPSYLARTRETRELGVATAAKLFDIYLQAAPEIIANLPQRAACAGATLFDAANRCDARGFTCLIGIPATTEHVAVCNETVRRAADVETGKQLAVALLAAAAHTCE